VPRTKATVTPSADASALPEAAPEADEPRVITPMVGFTMPVGSTLTSAACDGRSYDRTVRLDGASRSVVFEDRLAACAPATPCALPRVVVRRGSYRVEGPAELGRPYRVVLSVTEAQAPRETVALPSHLLWWESRGVLTEPDESCSYR